jgi:hypothetical protein
MGGRKVAWAEWFRTSLARLGLIALTAFPLLTQASAVAAQQPTSLAGLVVRIGWGPTDRIDAAYGLGLELEAVPENRLVPSVRLDVWDFGIMCTGFAPCPSWVETYSAGAKYRLLGATRLVPYGGADIGYMSWASDASGISLRFRAGADVRIVRHVGLVFDGSYSRFIELSEPEGRMLQNSLIGFTAGLRLWY